MNNKNVKNSNNSEMAQHLNQVGAIQNNATSFEERLKSWYAANARRLKTLCGNDDDARRLMAASMNTISKIPSLAECTFESFVRCLLTSAEFRLYPGAAAECAYVPFNNSKIGKKEATFIIQYQGTCQLLYRSGMIKDIECNIVCSQDYFEFKRGSNRSLVFEPLDAGLDDRGDWLGVYCIIRNIFGGEHITYMSAKDVMSIKARSRASGSRESPWNSEHATDRAWMWMKTALKQCAKLAPRSATTSLLVAEAMATDDDSKEVSSNQNGNTLNQEPRLLAADERAYVQFDAKSEPIEVVADNYREEKIALKTPGA